MVNQQIHPSTAEDLKNMEWKNPCPRKKAWYLSKLTHFWAEPFLWQGYKNPLITSDLWDLDPKFTSNELVPIFNANLMEKTNVTKNGVSIFPALVKTFGVSCFFGALMQIIVAG